MKNKKHLFYVMSFTICCLVLIACSKAEINRESNDVIVHPEDVQSETIEDIKMLSAGSQDGYYNVITDEDGKMNIMYVDYKAKKQIYLCDKSECLHDQEECTSFIAQTFSGRKNMLVTDNHYLYFISSEYSDVNSISSSINYGNNGITELDQPTEVYRMNLDGSNKKRLASLNSGEVLVGDFFTDGMNIYGVVVEQSKLKLDDYTTYTDLENANLISISIAGGELKKITEWDSNWNILGTFNNELIVKQLEFEQELTLEEKSNPDTYLAAVKKAKDIIVAYDLKTNEQRNLLTNNTNEGFYYEISENNVFYYTCEGDKIMSLDLRTETADIFLESKYSNIIQIFDGYMMVSDWSDNQNPYLLNLTDKKIQPFTLLKNNGLPVNMIAQTEELFFVESNCEVEEEYVEWAGVTQTIETNREYAIISKDDFFNGNKNFEKVTLLVEELY